jgi:hypothetical protein
MLRGGTHEGSYEMRRFGLLLVLAAVAGFATPSFAYLTAGKTTGTEVAVLQVGPDLWDLTVETDGNADAGGTLGITGTSTFIPNTAICDPGATILICGTVDGDDVGDPTTNGNLYIILAVVQAGALNSGVNTPRVLGQVQGPDVGLTVNGIGLLTGGADTTGLPEPVAFFRRPLQTPEPAAMVFLGLGFASLAFLRRHAA